MPNQGMTTYVERLVANPDYQALVAEMEQDAVMKLDRLVSLPPHSDQVEPLRASIRTLLDMLDAPHVYQRQLVKRRERAQNG